MCTHCEVVSGISWQEFARNFDFSIEQILITGINIIHRYNNAGNDEQGHKYHAPLGHVIYYSQFDARDLKGLHVR